MISNRLLDRDSGSRCPVLIFPLSGVSPVDLTKERMLTGMRHDLYTCTCSYDAKSPHKLISISSDITRLRFNLIQMLFAGTSATFNIRLATSIYVSISVTCYANYYTFCLRGCRLVHHGRKNYITKIA